MTKTVNVYMNDYFGRAVLKRSRLVLVGRVENFTDGAVHQFEADGEEFDVVSRQGILYAFCSCERATCTKPHQESFQNGYLIHVEAGFVLVELNN